MRISPVWEIDGTDLDGCYWKFHEWLRAHDLDIDELLRVAVHETDHAHVIIATEYARNESGNRYLRHGEAATRVVSRTLTAPPPGANLIV